MSDTTKLGLVVTYGVVLAAIVGYGLLVLWYKRRKK